MLVVTRLRVPEAEADGLRAGAGAVLAALRGRPGFRQGWLGQAPDDPSLWVLASTWEHVGAYRRALSSYDVKLAYLPVMQHVVDEPSAFEVLETVTAEAPGR